MIFFGIFFFTKWLLFISSSSSLGPTHSITWSNSNFSCIWCIFLSFHQNRNLKTSFWGTDDGLEVIFATAPVTEILLVFFKILTCWCSVMFRQVLSRYIWYPRLPVSAVKEFMAIFSWGKLLIIVHYLIFPFLKEKKWLNRILLYFSFLFRFWIFKCQLNELVFRMSNINVNFSNVLFLVFFRNYFEKLESEQASLRHRYNEEKRTR